VLLYWTYAYSLLKFFVQVHEDTKETGKTAFVNFKNAVWHESFHTFLQTVIETDEVGRWIKCGDGMLRWLFIIPLIFSADFEE
jgi:hypothetical protein